MSESCHGCMCLKQLLYFCFFLCTNETEAVPKCKSTSYMACNTKHIWNNFKPHSQISTSQKTIQNKALGFHICHFPGIIAFFIRWPEESEQ